jgi:hypothetical protein
MAYDWSVQLRLYQFLTAIRCYLYRNHTSRRCDSFVNSVLTRELEALEKGPLSLPTHEERSILRSCVEYVLRHAPRPRTIAV